MWRTENVHVLLVVNATSPAALEAAFLQLERLIVRTGGAWLLATQDAGALVNGGGAVTLKEHFGFTDGFGNPDYLGICRATQPGQGKLMPDGSCQPLATGELLLGYADEAGELPVASVPHLLATNGTFMVYRKLHQNVATFRRFLNEWSARYGSGDDYAREKLAAKFIGRWRWHAYRELA